MVRFTLLPILTMSALALAACNSEAEQQQQKADNAQLEANQTIADTLQAADKQVAAAQADADEKIAEAQASFAKLVEDYRHKATADLADLDKKVEALDAKALKATGKAKADLNLRLAQIRATRTEYVSDLRDLETGQATTWDAAKLRAEKVWSDLQELVNRS